MKDVVEVFHSRISNPFYGYFIFSFISVNWQALFYLLISADDVTTRIKYFSNNSDWISLLLIPVIIGVTFTILFPWINYIFLKFRKIPTDWRNKLQANSEHELLQEKQKFAEARVRLEKANLKAEQTSLKAEEAKQKNEELMNTSGQLKKRAENNESSSHAAILLERAQKLEDKAFE